MGEVGTEPLQSTRYMTQSHGHLFQSKNGTFPLFETNSNLYEAHLKNINTLIYYIV